ncbi:MAG: cysteine hydrolase family protein [Planctomycetota bacterium]
MILQLHKKRRWHLLIDIDTQKDFLLASGRACVRNQAEVLTNIRRVMAWAWRNNIPVISTAEVYPNNNGCSEIGYCLDGTDGQKKVPCTLLTDRVSFPADNKNALPADILLAYRQVILHKRCIDPFNEPRIERLLSEVEVDEFILIGAGTEDAVRATALGLLHRGRKVRIIVDALGTHNKRKARLALRAMKTKGAQLVETSDIAGVYQLRPPLPSIVRSIAGEEN